MSRTRINAYRKKLADLHAASGSLNEGVLSKAFGDLLEAWGRSVDLVLVPQWEGKGPKGNHIKVDGALVPSVLRVPFGYWEAKDSKDDLTAEIAKKRAAGYPDDNIVYEDTVTAVLRQNGAEVDRTSLADDTGLLRLLAKFFAFERPEIAEFRKAAAQFRADLPVVLDALRHALDDAEAKRPDYKTAAAEFLAHARSAINPAVTPGDVREMLIQHVLTEEIFASIFDNAGFHRENNVAKRLGALEQRFFTGDLRHQTVARLKPYYNAIKHAATGIGTAREKQTFLKRLYEDFYKVYNPKAADRLGVVYTPGEIVRFMIRGADWLCEQHFKKCLINPGVEILDPATGTGTFIVELLEHFRGQGAERIRLKYLEELHANEVAILPYYVANLNIEATYAAIMGEYLEFPNLCFVDTLDNTAGLGIYAGHQHELLGGMSDENIGRIKRQNERKISVVIGNPPYNANQQNENDDNKNRTYTRIDERIRNTYIRESNATKTKLYDPYIRFLRWASDRIKGEGVVAFITNRSFLDSKMADGFRRVVSREFDLGYIVDLGGDYKKKGLAGGGNVFGIGTGVAISFWLRSLSRGPKRRIFRVNAPAGSGLDKLSWLSSSEIESADWTQVKLDQNGWWDAEIASTREMVALVDKTTKGRDDARADSSLFKMYSLGISTNRDDWVYDKNAPVLQEKMIHLIKAFDDQKLAATVKWSRNLKRRQRAGRSESFSADRIERAYYRPFTKTAIYRSSLFIDEVGLADKLFPLGGINRAIVFSDPTSQKEWMALAVDLVPDLHFVGAASGAVYSTRHRYTPSGERVDNITDWALAQFRQRYAAEPGGPAITKDDIFAYTYAALHDPVWRETYAADLRRQFPRIMLHDGFARWAAWGRALLDLHIGYEAAAPFALARADAPEPKRGVEPKLKSVLPDGAPTGSVIVDSVTALSGIPRAAWDYRLGNRSAIDWVLDQHKEKTIKDPTVRARFDTYRLADHKKAMIALLARVVTVSLETVKIVDAMRAERAAG